MAAGTGQGVPLREDDMKGRRVPSDMQPTATMMILVLRSARQEWIAERRKEQFSDWGPQTVEAECS